MTGGAALALALALWSAAASRPVELGRGFLADWQRGDLNSMYGRLSPEFQERWAKPDFDRFFAEQPLRVLSEKSWKEAGHVHYAAQLQLPGSVEGCKLSFDAAGRVAGLRLSPGDASQPYPSPHERRTKTIGFPLPTGDWTAWELAHAAKRSQRFAVDLRLLKAGDSWAGDGRDLRSYHSFGRTVVSPVDGVVALASDGAPDNAPGRPADADGNSITIKVDDSFYVHLEHLRQGTLLVAAGQRVKRGQPLGQVGNSGRSSEPHLHVEAFDALPRRTADAWPLAFENILVNGRRKSQAPARPGDVVVASR